MTPTSMTGPEDTEDGFSSIVFADELSSASCKYSDDGGIIFRKGNSPPNGGTKCSFKTSQQRNTREVTFSKTSNLAEGCCREESIIFAADSDNAYREESDDGIIFLNSDSSATYRRSNAKSFHLTQNVLSIREVDSSEDPEFTQNCERVQGLAATPPTASQGLKLMPGAMKRVASSSQ